MRALVSPRASGTRPRIGSRAVRAKWVRGLHNLWPREAKFMRATFAVVTILTLEQAAVAHAQDDLHTYSRCVIDRLLIAASETPANWRVIIFDEGEIAMNVMPGRNLALDAELL